jgi:hypothetical protein
LFSSGEYLLYARGIATRGANQYSSAVCSASLNRSCTTLGKQIMPSAKELGNFMDRAATNDIVPIGPKNKREITYEALGRKGCHHHWWR